MPQAHRNPQQFLTPLQWTSLLAFFSSPISAPFFLTGGTALAGFYFGHRRSVDLDLFTLTSLDRERLKNTFSSIASSLGGAYEVRTESPTILTGFIATPDNTLKIDVVQDIPIHVGEFLVVEGIRVDALDNIGSNKITAVYGRQDAKDYVDLYWMLEVDKRLSFPDLLAVAKKKDLGISDFHLGHMFLNPPPIALFPPTTPVVDPNSILEFFRKLGTNLLNLAGKPSFG